MYKTFAMLHLGTLYLLLSLNVVSLNGDDVNEIPQTDTASQHRAQSWHDPQPAHRAPGTYGQNDTEPMVPRWHPSSPEEADRQGVIGEYTDVHNNDAEFSLYNSELSPTDFETVKEVGPPRENHVPTAISPRGILPEITQEHTPQDWPVEASGWDVYDTAITDKKGPLPSAKPSETTDNRFVASVPLPRSVPTYVSDLDLTPQTWGGTVSPSVTVRGSAPDTPRTELVTEHGFAGSTTERGNNSQDMDHDSVDQRHTLDTLPDCNIHPADTNCKSLNNSFTPIDSDDFKPDQSPYPFPALSPPLLVPLYSDWNAALATWGLAWEAQTYGLASIFAIFGLISAVCLLGLVLRCPTGGPYFTLLHLFLLAFAGDRAFSLIYDAYGHQERLPPLACLLLSELSFPCLASAFSLAFVLLSLRSRMNSSLRLSLSASSFSASPRPCLLFCLSLFHWALSLACVGLLQLLPAFPALLLLPSGLFVCLSIVLPCYYLISYCFIRAQTKHIYRLGNNREGGASPEVLRPTKYPFAEVEDWGRAASAGLAASLCLAACGGLQLYGLLHALGVGGVMGHGFQAWPWWGYQLGCRLCEVGVCLGLSLIGSYPLFCPIQSSTKSTAPLQPGSWSQLPHGSPPGGPEIKFPVLSAHFPWSQSTQEKLVVCEVISKGQSEALPLCAIVDLPKNGINISTSTPVPPLPTPPRPPQRAGDESKLSSLDSLNFDTDSTADLRPPSPIDLSRSIDQALFSEALFSHSLFAPQRLLPASSSLSLHSPGRGGQTQGYSSAETSLYRTSSCGDVDQESSLPKSRPSQPRGDQSHNHKQQPSTSPEQRNWKGSGSFCQASGGGSSQGLCCSPGKTRKTRSYPWAGKGQGFSQSSFPRAIPHLPYHRRYRTLSLASRDGGASGGRLEGAEHLSKSRQLEQDLEVQAEFVNVCKQIDSLSVCSDTIEL